MRSFFTIRAQLQALVAAFMLPMIGIIAYSIYDNAQHQIEEVKGVARTLAVTAATDINRMLESNRDLLLQMAKRPIIRKVDIHNCDRILWDFRQLFPKSANMTLINLQGTAICSAVPQPDGKPISIAKAPWFPRTQAAEGLSISDPFYGPITGRWVTVLTYPVRDDAGKKVGYLGLPLDLALYAPNLSLAPLQTDTVAGVVTAKGVLAWRNIDTEKWVGRDLSDDDKVRKILSVRDGEIEAVGADGMPRFYSITPIAGLDWYVYVGIPTKTAYEKLEESLVDNALYGIVSLLAILGFAWFIAKQITGPVGALASVARAVRSGQGTARVVVDGPPEICEVAQEFNEMLDVRLRHEEALRTSEASLNEALRIAKLAYWEYEFASGEFVLNDQYFTLHDATVEQFGGYRLQAEGLAERWMHPDDVHLVGEFIRRAQHASDQQLLGLVEARILCVGGAERWITVSAKIEKDAQGIASRLIGTAQDITDRKHAENLQRRLNRSLKLLSDCNTTLVHATAEHKLLDDICHLVVSRGGYSLAWVGFAEFNDEKTVRVVAEEGDSQDYLGTVKFSWADVESGQGPTGTAIRTGLTDINQDFSSNPRMHLWRDAALVRGLRASIALPLHGKKGVLGALTIYSSETNAFESEEVKLLEELAGDLAYGIETLRTRIEHEAAERQLEFLAHHDMLTSLPNRVLLRDRFEQACAQADRSHTGVAMLFLDLDNFKQVNDTLGHTFGDRLLVDVVERLQACLRDSDTISRQGGDEFVVLLPHLSDITTIGGIAQHIVEVFSEPFGIDDYSINTTFSVGISMYPSDSREFDTLLRNADTALYQAKDSGRNTYRFFSEKMNIDAQEQLFLQGQLRNALTNNEFALYFQPQVEIGTERVIGAEALLRWQHPEQGLIPPGKFIPLAERSGLIIPIGEWVLREACRQAQEWSEQGNPLIMAVNLSALQFKRGTLIETVASALQESGLPAEMLELELTESILLQDIDVAIRMLHTLKEMGVRLSIDDFGTGYSSLSYLKRLAVDKLKIDQSFVRDLPGDADSAAIVRAIIQLGHTLQLKVIAEGVEEAEQLAFLRDHGCEEVQGYLYSRPVPAADFMFDVARS